MMTPTKNNVEEFNGDVKANGGYLYTTNPTLSSTYANKRITEALAAYIPKDCKTLVDIGCGDGVYTAEIKQMYPDIEIEGFDPAVEAIYTAQKKYTNIKFSVMNILSEHLDKETHQFDVGVIRGVLHHLPDQEFALKNAFKICETVIIMEPNGNNPILKVIEKVSPYHRTHEEQSFMFRTLKKWTEQAGGEVIANDYVGFIPFFFPDFPTKIIFFFQPFLEKFPLVREILSGQIIMLCKRRATTD